MENKKIILKEIAFHYFDSVYNLDSQHYLLIKKKVEMSYTCFDAYIYKKKNHVTLNETNNSNKVVSVCSWTNIDGSNLSEENSTINLLRLEPIKINFDERTKVLSYRFIKQTDGKYENRKAKYKNGNFIIKSYDARNFDE